MHRLRVTQLNSKMADRLKQLQGHIGPLSGNYPAGMFADQTAIITGSGQGIGAECAKLFAKDGAKVVVCDIDKAKAEAVAKEINESGGKAIACAGDVTSQEYNDELVKKAAEFGNGKIHHLVLNVIHKMTDKQLDAMINVHNKAPFMLVRAAAPYFRVTDGENRTITTVSSTTGVNGNAGQLKAGGFAVYGDEKVAIGIPGAGGPATGGLKDIPLQRGGTPTEAAGAIIALASPLMSYVTGHVLSEEARLLEEARAVVKQQTRLMLKCLETPGKLMDALKCSSTLVSELRTSSLGPKLYYELYMDVFDALRHLSAFLRESHPVNHLADLYELVRCERRGRGLSSIRLSFLASKKGGWVCGNIIPRLYLMITVGTVYMSIEDAPVKEIMKDMMEMSRGVQHPIRPEGNLTDSISFVLNNFVEMNKLWVRLQHQGHSREREKRTQERKELQLLVGSNLVRLSQLVDLEAYQKTILGPLLEQVVQCRDKLAQEYLLEVIIQVFPDEFHLHTLNEFLSATARLNPDVNVKSIVIALMDRLSNYASRDTSSESAEDRKAKEMAAVEALLEKLKLGQTEKPAPVPEPQPEPESEPVEPVPKPSEGGEEAQPKENGEEGDSKEEPVETDDRPILSRIKLYEIFYNQVVNLANQNILGVLLAPLNSYVSLFTVLALPNYVPLLHVQSYQTRRAVASSVIKTVLSNSIKISTEEHVQGVLNLVQVLIKESAPQQTMYPGTQQRRLREADSDEVVEEQGWLARLVHVINSDDNDVQYKLLQATQKAFAEGGDRVKHTTPAMITACVKLARRLKTREHFDDGWQTKSQSLYKFAHQMLSALYTRVGCADLCLRLFVMCGQIADQGESFEEAAYEFFAQAFTIYEEAISDSRAQFQAVCIIAGALHSTRNFSKENYDTLITKCALHGSKLLKKPDQCRAVYLASHLWWAVEIPAREEEDGKPLYRDGKRVLECLQRALRVADNCMDAAVSIELFVEILNRYVYYFDQQNEAVTVRYINGLIELIHSNLGNSSDSAANESPKAHFERTLEYIASRDYEGVVTDIKG
ncbi:vacuolar protein sorting-associated protein 35 [Drechslerella dactyloides]|uniref:Vacuolar protein sorting-associated protein 35 n=1 Tax=Drechslerella dactyloides TaxID=74499 RepID=A0AAD6NLQ7_DREDA|nr:vacuolar protein sorting-associated protein 35 [Drechslerella dactyloides]